MQPRPFSPRKWPVHPSDRDARKVAGKKLKPLARELRAAALEAAPAG
jgi:hypothetical protein